MRIYFTVIGLAGILLMGACSGARQTASRKNASSKNAVVLAQRADSLFFAAQRSKMLGDYSTAITQYIDYLRLNKNNATVNYELARLFMETQHAENALIFARRAAALDPQNHWFQVTLADAYAVNQRFDSAAYVFDGLTNRYPDNEDYLYNKGILLAKANKPASALATFNQLEKKVGVVEELIYQKQKLLLKMSMVDEAAAEIQKLIDQNPQEIRYYYLLAEIYDANDRVPDAASVYHTILTKDPDNPRALIALASYARKNNDMATYWANLTKAFANPNYNIDEKVAYVYPYLQMLNLDTAKLDEGLRLTALIIRAHPQDAKAYALQGDMFSQADMIDSAEVSYKKAISLDDTRFSVWYQLMWIYSRKDDPTALLTLSNNVTTKFPKEFMGYYFKGVASFLLQQYPNAINSLNTALEIGNGEKKFLGDIYSLLGDAYHATGQHKQSDSSYERALLLRPKDALIMNNYSYYLSLRGENLDRAAEMSKQSLEIEPDSPTYMDTYAWILFRQEKFTEARQWIEKALQYPEAQKNPNVLEHYGDILFNLKEVTKAVEYWQMAKDKGASSVDLVRKIAEKRYIQ
ncbi:tetratricopeptide repeat protein [Chitinophaga polysaccharea]|uniref:tetratricopeptide repeat protein n=1 Tax=Chitinophaga TaxID=79328 RepID=UPI001455D331|nr:MULTISPECIES: tetratricopeptide repeat protein [Chitinophaga]NLR61946.1 tetratricopeptide repeat protein [Chitinophaga polysaccharea]NLU94495.1 tetratricopeptide repeat protein [Chitinophaga sp. Ak27]